MLLNSLINFKDDATDYIINDQTSLKSGWSADPHYYIRVQSADGLYGADISAESHEIPHAIGEKSGDTFRRGKGLTLSGTIEGQNLGALEAATDYLQQMFWNTAQRHLIWTKNETQVYYICRVLNDLTITPNLESYSPTFSWTVGLRADDPRLRNVSDDLFYYAWMA